MQAAECQRFLFDDKTPWASPPGSCRFRRADAESARFMKGKVPLFVPYFRSPFPNSEGMDQI